MVFDLDGTLYNSHHCVSPVNADAVRRAHEAGYGIVLATGRGPTHYVPTGKELGVPGGMCLIGYNGAVVFKLNADGGIEKSLFETKLTQEQMDKVLRLSEGLCVELDIGMNQYVTCVGTEQQALLDDHAKLCQSKPQTVPDFAGLPPPNKMTTLTRDPQGLVRAAKEIRGFEDDGIGITVGGPYWCETITLKSDKATGLKLVCEKLGTTPADCIYFGDGGNDATALALAGLGIAMRDAKPEALAAANKRSEWGNDEDAVAKEIDLILKGK